jgi:multisubunit Na+/H+ antiporter MnhG subunit
MNNLFESFVVAYLYFACAVWGFWLYIFIKLGFFKLKDFFRR